MSRAIMAMLAFALFVTTATEAPAPTRRMEDFGDFIGNYNFRLELEGVDAGQFTAVDGLSIEQEVIEYQSGEDNLTRKLPGRVKYGDITLKRGYRAQPEFWNWIEKAAHGKGERINGVLTLKERDKNELVPVVKWNLFNCFPSERAIRTEQRAKDLRILVESIRLSCDAIEELILE